METIIIPWIGFALLVGLVGKNRKIGFGMAFFLALILSPIIGIIIALLSKTKKEMEEEHKFKADLELAKKAEFKGQLDQAIDHYMDSLYHLENDYKNLDKKSEEGRQKHIKSIKDKIEALKKLKSEKSTTN
jgi:uncharacterized membrane-anchored protein YhcB (DUF1043 family)